MLNQWKWLEYLEYWLTNKYISGPIQNFFQINILKGNLYPYVVKQLKIFILILYI